MEIKVDIEIYKEAVFIIDCDADRIRFQFDIKDLQYIVMPEKNGSITDQVIFVYAKKDNFLNEISLFIENRDEVISSIYTLRRFFLLPGQEDIMKTFLHYPNLKMKIAGLMNQSIQQQEVIDSDFEASLFKRSVEILLE